MMYYFHNLPFKHFAALQNHLNELEDTKASKLCFAFVMLSFQRPIQEIADYIGMESTDLKYLIEDWNTMRENIDRSKIEGIGIRDGKGIDFKDEIYSFPKPFNQAEKRVIDFFIYRKTLVA